MTTIKFDHNSWQNCANWYNMAEALKKASNKIREAYLEAYRNLNIGKSVSVTPEGNVKIYADITKMDIDDLDQFPIAMLLMGYAIENIFKGIIICGMWLEDPKLVDYANLVDLQVPVKGSDEKMGIIKHELVTLLAAKHMTLNFLDEEKAMMDKLVMFVKWGGRYPTPKEFDPIDPFGLGRFEPIEYPYQVIDTLYAKTIEELIRLCKLQGDKLSG